MPDKDTSQQQQQQTTTAINFEAEYRGGLPEPTYNIPMPPKKTSSTKDTNK